MDPDREVLITSGGKEATIQLPILVGGDGARGLFPDPGYPGYLAGVRLAGMEPVPVPLGGDFHLRAADLPDDDAGLLWINTPHNPTGAVLDLDALRELHDWCAGRDALLISDECYADVYDEVAPPSALQVGTRNTLVVHSLSKRSGLTGYRVGFVAGDADWIARLRELRSHVGLPVPEFVAAAAERAWGDDAHVEHRRTAVTGRRRRVRAFLERTGHTVVASEATFYLWVRPPGGMDDLAYAEHLKRFGILVGPGRFYGVTEAGRGHVRVAACPQGPTLDAALDTWAHALEEL